MSKRKPYKDRTDLEKIQSQWNKLSGLHTKEEWSAAIVRAATAAEIAANFAVRREFGSRSTFSAKFVDSLLRWANGLKGKIDRLLIPLSSGKQYHKTIQNLEKNSAEINDLRNRIAHRGEFCSGTKAKEIIQKSKEFVETLIQIYEPTFTLKDKNQ